MLLNNVSYVYLLIFLLQVPLINSASGRRLSLSPPATNEVPHIPEEGYWPNLLGQLRSAPPQPHPHNGFAAASLPPPPPPPQAPPIHVGADPAAARAYSIPPPPNFMAEGRTLVDNLELQIINLLNSSSNMQQIQQLLNSSMGQTTSTAPPFTYQVPNLQPTVEGWGSPTHHLQRLLTPAIPVSVPPKPTIFTPTAAWASPTFLPTPSPPQPIFSPYGTPHGLIWSQAPTTLITSPANPMMTPVGQKRRLLPSPEPSPEGNYIGQHSQGIGGHYADSFFKRKKKH